MEENDALLAAWRGAVEPAAADEPELARSLAQLVERGRAAWPALDVPADRFVRHVARHFPSGEPTGPWLERVRAGDLYLACACEVRAPGAIEAFDRSCLSALPAILQRNGWAAQADEIRQRVRERLFVGAAKIADYSGRGALAHWLEVVTLRIAIDLKRQDRLLLMDSSGVAAAFGMVDADPELELLKERCREPLERAFREALAQLSSEQRNLLKLHFVDEVTLEDLAALFRVHRATIVRRIAAAREAVLDGARERLQAELSLAPAELDSLMRIIRSRIEISLSVFLRD
jgi:RNA polymerase sigma-70 factor (ECF subfamily)